MLEKFEIVKLEDGTEANQIKIEFESDVEAEMIFASLHQGFPVAYVQHSQDWLNLFENKAKMAQYFAVIWVLVKMARESESNEYFNKAVKTNTFFYDTCKNMEPEAARLMAVFLDSAGKTRVRRVASAKEIRKRLVTFKEILLSQCGEDFRIFSLEMFPEIKVKSA